MNKTSKKLLMIITILVIIKTILTLFIPTPSIYTDEYIYTKMAQSFFQNLEFSVHSIITSNYHPLYPIMMSITFLTNSVPVAYLLMKILNVILSTLIIIPAYLISKEFLDSKKAVVAATIVALLPMNFVFPGFIMAESLFYPLFLTSLYFIFKSFTKTDYKYDILAGIFIGLTFLTRFAGIALITIVILALIYKLFKKEFFEIKKKILMGAVTLIVISPWLIRNALLFGANLSGLLGQYSVEITAQVQNYHLNLLYWILIYSSYLLLASLIIITIFAFSNLKEKFKDKKLQIFYILAIITIIVIIIGGAQHASKSALKENTDLPNLIGRPIGRYVDTALPILFLLGIISYYKYQLKNKSTNTILLISIPLVILSSQLLYFALLPANNITLTLLGIINLGLTSLLNQKISIILITLFLLLTLLTIHLIIKKSKTKVIKPMALIVIILITTSLVAYSGIIYNAKTNWENHPQIKLSHWINENIDKNAIILIDEDYCGTFNKTTHDVLCSKGKSTALAGLWILNPISIKSIDYENTNYIITMKTLELKQIRKTENGIFLYEVD